jgi:hypothetical protein
VTNAATKLQIACVQWRELVASQIAAASHLTLFEANGSVINFKVEPELGRPLGVDDLQRVYRWLTCDLSPVLERLQVRLPSELVAVAKTVCFIGQPVQVAKQVGVLRIALASKDVRAILCGRGDEILAEDARIVQKLSLIAKHFDSLSSLLP